MIDLHPGFIDTMIAGGLATQTDAAIVLCAVQAALWKAWTGERRPRQVDDAPPLVAVVAPVAPESPGVAPVAGDKGDMRMDSQLAAGQSLSPKQRKRLRDKVRVRNLRAAARAATEATPASDKSDISGDRSDSSSDSVGALSLSLKINSNSSRERESKSRSESPLSRSESLAKGDSGDTLPAMREAAGLMTLPLDFQPTEAGAKFVRDRLGSEVAAADCLAKFRVHFIDGDGKDERRTATGWHARWRKWGIDERIPFNGAAQCSLPLVSPLNGGQSHGGRRSLAAVADELIARADERKLRNATATGPPGDGVAAAG